MMHDAIEGAATGEKLKSELQSWNSKGKTCAIGMFIDLNFGQFYPLNRRV
jgi:hypothetical protein